MNRMASSRDRTTAAAAADSSEGVAATLATAAAGDVPVAGVGRRGAAEAETILAPLPTAHRVQIETDCGLGWCCEETCWRWQSKGAEGQSL